MAEPEKQIRVFVVDDHRLTRTALKNIFSVATDVMVVGEAVDGQELFRNLPDSESASVRNGARISGQEAIPCIR